jgi:secondary thiamine-phosphate synthase enzyme
MRTLEIETHRHCEMIDITRLVETEVAQMEITNGTIELWVPHTTAAITVNECADPDVPHDFLLALERIVPAHQAGFRHGEGNSDAHLKSSLVGCSHRLLVEGGHLVLGTWQGVFFCEFDGPRHRRLLIR